MRNNIRKLAILMLGLTLAPSAHAYLDPGTGSILIQGLIAGVVGALVGIKFYWEQLKSFLLRRKTHSMDNPTKPHDPS